MEAKLKCLSPLKMFSRWSNAAAYIFTPDKANQIIYWNENYTNILTSPSNSYIRNGFWATYAKAFM